MKIQKATMVVGYSSHTGNTWEEDIEVGTFETAEETSKRIIANFNATLRPHEKSREFITIVKEWE